MSRLRLTTSQYHLHPTRPSGLYLHKHPLTPTGHKGAGRDFQGRRGRETRVQGSSTMPQFSARVTAASRTSTRSRSACTSCLYHSSPCGPTHLRSPQATSPLLLARHLCSTSQRHHRNGRSCRHGVHNPASLPWNLRLPRTLAPVSSLFKTMHLCNPNQSQMPSSSNSNSSSSSSTAVYSNSRCCQVCKTSSSHTSRARVHSSTW